MCILDVVFPYVLKKIYYESKISQNPEFDQCMKRIDVSSCCVWLQTEFI